MNEFNLTVNELEQDKKYQMVGICGDIKKYAVYVDQMGYVIADDDEKKVYVSTKTMFKEVKPERERIILREYLNLESRTTVFMSDKELGVSLVDVFRRIPGDRIIEVYADTFEVVNV